MDDIPNKRLAAPVGESGWDIGKESDAGQIVWCALPVESIRLAQVEMVPRRPETKDHVVRNKKWPRHEQTEAYHK